LRFDQDLIKGAGTINIFRLSDTNLHESLDVASTNIHVTNTTATIYFENALQSLTTYFVIVTNTAFRDDLTNYFAGITNSTTWYFTAADFSGPYITNVTSTNADSSYTVGDNINVRVYFSEPIQHFGTHGMRLATGGSGRNAVYQSAGINYLDLRYTVQAGDNSPDLQYTSIAAFTNDTGSWIQDLSGNDANLTLPPLASPNSLAGNKQIVIDTIAPLITNVTSTNLNGLYTTNVTINVLVQFSEPVYVVGTPALRLETGATGRDAVYLSGDTTTNLVLEYVVMPGDWTTNLNYVTTNSFSNSFGGSIRDAAGNYARMGLKPLASTNALGGNKAIAIDTLRPTVLNVTSTNLNGYYRAGAVLDVRFEISEPVTVGGGSPQLALNPGPSATAFYASILNETNLLFTYTVAAGENSSDLDYLSASAFNVMGALVRDAAGNPLVTNLPAPGYPGSLGANKDLVIDTIPPTVTVASDSTTPTNGSPILLPPRSARRSPISSPRPSGS